jgi:hypothetical protein
MSYDPPNPSRHRAGHQWPPQSYHGQSGYADAFDGAQPPPWRPTAAQLAARSTGPMSAPPWDEYGNDEPWNPAAPHWNQDPQRRDDQHWNEEPGAGRQVPPEWSHESQERHPEPRQWSPVPQEWNPEPRQWSPEPQDWTPEPQERGPEPQDWRPEPRQWSHESQEWNPEPQEWTPEPWSAEPVAEPEQRPRGLIVSAVIGFLGAAVAIGVATLAAAFFRPQASPIIAVGEAFIDRTPPALKNFAVEKFGENDKTMLLLGMYVTIVLLAMTIGILARRKIAIGVVGVGVFGLFGGFVAYTRPASKPTDVIPAIIGGIAGVAALLWLAHAAQPQIRPQSRLRAERQAQR